MATPVGQDPPADPLAGLPEVIERLRPAVRRLLYRERIPAWDGDDLFQRAVAAGLRRWSTITDKEQWLYETVRWMCLIYWRRRRQDRVVTLDTRFVRAAAPAEEQRELLLDLRIQCARLPRPERRLLYLRFQLGMTLAEVAGELRMSVSSVLRHQQAALERLHLLLLPDRCTPGGQRCRNHPAAAPARASSFAFVPGPRGRRTEKTAIGYPKEGA
jgi:RNA polymerase sigma factor (sigma-70 family)